MMKRLLTIAAVVVAATTAGPATTADEYKVYLPVASIHYPTFGTESSTWAMYDRCKGYFTLDSIPEVPHGCQIIHTVFQGNDRILADDGHYYCIYPSMLYHNYHFTVGQELTLVISPWVRFTPDTFEAGHLDVTLVADYGI